MKRRVDCDGMLECGDCDESELIIQVDTYATVILMLVLKTSDQAAIQVIVLRGLFIAFAERACSHNIRTRRGRERGCGHVKKRTCVNALSSE